MRRIIVAGGLLSLLVVGPMAAQQGQPQPRPQGPPAVQPAVPGQADRQMQRQHDMLQNMDRLMVQLRETNRWMAQNQVENQYRTLGRQMERTAEQLRNMERSMTQIRPEVAAQRDQDRLREMDQLRDRLHQMQLDLEGAHAALRKMVGRP